MGKWMTETRDQYRKFTDSPNDNTYYIGNQMNGQRNMHPHHGDPRNRGGFGGSDDEDSPKREETKAAANRRPKTAGRQSNANGKGPKQNQRDLKNAKLNQRAGNGKYTSPQKNKAGKSGNRSEDEDDDEDQRRWSSEKSRKSLENRPIWHPYGRANTNPAVGGYIYGNYLYSHNINPERGENKPFYQQVYNNVHDAAFSVGKSPVSPTRERRYEEPDVGSIEEVKNRLPIMPEVSSVSLKRTMNSTSYNNDKRGGSKRSAVAVSKQTQSKETPNRTASKRTKNMSMQNPAKQGEVGSLKHTSANPANGKNRVGQNRKEQRDFGRSEKQSTGDRRTMASTRVSKKPQNNDANGRSRGKEKSVRNLSPASPMTDFYPRAQDNEDGLEGNGYSPNNRAQGVTPTTFPVGFPY